MSESDSEISCVQCLKTPWEKLTKGLKEINDCNNCNISIGNKTEISNKNEISNNLEKLLKQINSTDNTQLQDDFKNMVNQIKVSLKLNLAFILRCHYI